MTATKTERNQAWREKNPDYDLRWRLITQYGISLEEYWDRDELLEAVNSR